MWFMVRGCRPWPTLDGNAAMMVATTGARPPMTTKTFSPQLIAVIASAWEHNPAFRPPAGELLAKLQDMEEQAVLRKSSGCLSGIRLTNPAWEPDGFKRSPSALAKLKRSASLLARSFSVSWKRPNATAAFDRSTTF